MLLSLMKRGRLGYVLCGLGLHWPRGWEPAYEVGWEELLCQRDDCRARLRRRPFAPATVTVPMAGINELRREDA